MEVRWVDYSVTAEQRSAFPGEVVLRPIISVGLHAPDDKPVRVGLLADTGSEYTLVNVAFARRLGIANQLSENWSETILIGGASRTAKFATVLVEIPGFDPYEAPVGFVDNWEGVANSGVLGQRGFFDRFGVVFDRANRRFGLMELADVDLEWPAAPTSDVDDAPPPPFRRGA